MTAKDAATMTTPKCNQCGDGKFNKWVWVGAKSIVYPMSINYHRDADGTIRCGACHIVLREAERQS